MDARPNVSPLIIAVVGFAIATTVVQSQVDQRTLAQQILAGSVGERYRALEQARLLGPQNTGPELRAALIKALEREGQLSARQYHADLRGEVLQPQEDPEFIARVARVVVQLRDPRAIRRSLGPLTPGGR